MKPEAGQQTAVGSGFVTRAAWSSFALALGAALLSAVITGALASWLLQRGEDQRLFDAASVLASELAEHDLSPVELEALVEEERVEIIHMGTAFAVFDRSGQRLAGDERLGFVRASTCASRAGTRWCGSSTARFTVVAGGAQASTSWLLLAAALTSSLAVAIIAFFFSRPLARSAVAPLTQLQRRLADSELIGLTRVDLGPRSQIIEIDALRHTIEVLLERVDVALTTATRFASDAAHELRTPLSTILCELELLATSGTPNDAFLRIRATAERLTLLVERLLVLATPGAAGEQTELISMRDSVEDAIASLSPSDRARATIIVLDDFSLRGDGALVSSMISNALSNGLKFGTRVTVRLSQNELVFEDDGPGVPREERARVFEPLYRGAAARAGRVPGNGLGLALIAHVAKWHGGRASFEDAPHGAVLLLRFSLTPSRDRG